MCVQELPRQDPESATRTTVGTAAAHVKQGWSLPCNAVVVLDDGEPLPAKTCARALGPIMQRRAAA